MSTRKIKEEIPMLIAIDHGNSFTKTPHFQFCSGVSEHLVRPPLADEIIEYREVACEQAVNDKFTSCSLDGKFWTLSSSRIAYMRNKTADNRFFVLTLFAIAKELSRAGCLCPLNHVGLAVGLPPEHYGKQRDEFARYFTRPCPANFVYNGVPLSLVIRRVFVYPQAFAAVAPQSARLAQTPRVFIVDVGGMTTDVLLLRGGKPDLQFCRSLETGIITMQNELVGKVNSLHEMLIEEDHITAVLQGRETILPAEVQTTIRAAAKQHANVILDKLRELQVDLRSNPAIFIGGGAILLRAYLEQSPLVTRAEFVENTCANATGYELLAAAELRRLELRGA
jgi:plasmid segregation protein ParM